MNKFTTKLTDVPLTNETKHKDIVATVTFEHGAIAISFEGYGDHYSAEGCGYPILIEQVDGVPRIVVWDDINVEEPSDLISLKGAAESNRKEEDNG